MNIGRVGNKPRVSSWILQRSANFNVLLIRSELEMLFLTLVKMTHVLLESQISQSTTLDIWTVSHKSVGRQTKE